MTTLIAATLRVGSGRKVAKVYHAQMETNGPGYIMRSFGRERFQSERVACRVSAIDARTELAGVLRAWAAILERGES